MADNINMSIRTKRVTGVIGAALGVFGILFSIPASFNQNYWLIGLSGVAVIVGLILIIYVWD